MNVSWTCVVISTLVVLAGACSQKNEQAPAVQPAVAPAAVPQEMPTDAPPPMPSDHRVPAVVEGDAGHAQEKLTPEELMGLVAPTEPPPRCLPTIACAWESTVTLGTPNKS